MFLPLLLFFKHPSCYQMTEGFWTWGFLGRWRRGLLQEHWLSICSVAFCWAVAAVVRGRTFSTENSLPYSSTELDDWLSTSWTVRCRGNTVLFFLVFFIDNVLKCYFKHKYAIIKIQKRVAVRHKVAFNIPKWLLFDRSSSWLCYYRNVTQCGRLKVKPNMAFIAALIFHVIKKGIVKYLSDQLKIELAFFYW